MPQATQPADNPFQRTRRDHAMETAEDYVEAIDRLIEIQGHCRSRDLASKFQVSHVTVHRIVARLHREGWLETQPYQPITLTGKGKRLARKSRERHEIVYRFLIAIGVEPKVAEIDAEGIEHHVSDETLCRLKSSTTRLEEKGDLLP